METPAAVAAPHTHEHSCVIVEQGITRIDRSGKLIFSCTKRCTHCRHTSTEHRLLAPLCLSCGTALYSVDVGSNEFRRHEKEFQLAVGQPSLDIHAHLQGNGQVPEAYRCPNCREQFYAYFRPRD